jgi:anti-anti-sigma regulatory factor
VPDRAALAGLHVRPDQPVTREPDAGSRIGQPIAGDGALRIDCAGNQLRLLGDIDEATHAGLVAALDGVADEPGAILVDLAGVEFCDLAGLRALVHLSQIRQDHPDRCVILRHPAAHLKALLEILGWESSPGLVIDESSDRLSS